MFMRNLNLNTAAAATPALWGGAATSFVVLIETDNQDQGRDKDPVSPVSFGRGLRRIT
jgi:hypothetical protein